MDIAVIVENVSKLTNISLYAVLLAIIGVMGWMLIRLVDRISDNTTIHREAIEANEEVSKRMLEVFEAHNKELVVIKDMTQRVLDFTIKETDWIKSLLNERLNQTASMMRLETAANNVTEQIGIVNSTVHSLVTYAQESSMRKERP